MRHERKGSLTGHAVCYKNGRFIFDKALVYPYISCPNSHVINHLVEWQPLTWWSVVFGEQRNAVIILQIYCIYW